MAVADTHIGRGSARRLPEVARAELARADLILHAGDVLVGEVLDDLDHFAPVRAVLGNNDVELAGQLPETLLLDVEGVRLGMVHDSGPRAGRERRLYGLFPGAHLVVFGHSHIPWDGPGIDGQWLLNPGSPTERRRQPQRTLAVVEVEDGGIASTRIVELG